MNRDIRKKAWKRVKRKKRFFLHFGITAVLGVFFFVLNIVTDPFDMWFIFPMIPLVSLVGIHYLFIYGFPGFNFMTREWEEREFEKQLEDLEDHYPPYRTGQYLDYTELSDEEALVLKKLQKKTASGNYFDEDLV